ncbi:Ankyrin repeat-containing protein itn1 [Datura stramonium]|uniref:Ankyrin repeat-containing protein itn1 n=1 Tax=Datura stramonium TaxID=4076 RepID=A0ABS8SYB4_DATST|nr:Ankyrin repeat-containing protein itn1 [Datura stramonium]
MTGIAKELPKAPQRRIPGGDLDTGFAVASNTPHLRSSIQNALALFTSLAVVVVQITVVRGETKSEKRVTGVINKLMWLAAVFTTLAFVSASYVVIGRRNIWAAIFVTVVAGIIMAGVLGAMTYYVVRSKRTRKIRKRRSLQGLEPTHFLTRIIRFRF